MDHAVCGGKRRYEEDSTFSLLHSSFCRFLSGWWINNMESDQVVINQLDDGYYEEKGTYQCTACSWGGPSLASKSVQSHANIGSMENLSVCTGWFQ